MGRGRRTLRPIHGRQADCPLSARRIPTSACSWAGCFGHVFDGPDGPVIEDPTNGEISWPCGTNLPVLKVDAMEPVGPPLRAVPDEREIPRFEAEGGDVGLNLMLPPKCMESPNSQEVHESPHRNQGYE